MFHDKLKLIGSVLLALAFVAGTLALSATNVAFAAGQSSQQALRPSGVADRVPGWCNFDNDQDKDDWCWAVTPGSGASGGYSAPSGGYSAPSSGYGYSAPSSNGYNMPSAGGTVTGTTAVVPYGTIIGQSDPTADTYGYSNNMGYGSGYSNMYGGGGYGGRYNGRFYLFNPFRFMGREERIERRLGLPPDDLFLSGRRFFSFPNMVLPWWLRRMR